MNMVQRMLLAVMLTVLALLVLVVAFGLARNQLDTTGLGSMLVGALISFYGGLILMVKSNGKKND